MIVTFMISCLKQNKSKLCIGHIHRFWNIAFGVRSGLPHTDLSKDLAVKIRGAGPAVLLLHANVVRRV
jgi:hypothetical protein